MRAIVRRAGNVEISMFKFCTKEAIWKMCTWRGKCMGICGKKYTQGKAFCALWYVNIHFGAPTVGRAHRLSRTDAQAQSDGRTGSAGRTHRLSRTVKGSAVSPRTQRLEPKQAHRTGARVKDRSTPSRRAGQLVRAGERSNAWIYVGTLLCGQTPFHT